MKFYCCFFLLSLILTEGRAVFAQPAGTKLWEFRTTHSVRGSPAIGLDGTLYVGSQNRFYAIDPDGQGIWEFPVEGFVVASPALGADGAIYFGSTDNHLYALHPDGTQRWAFLTGATLQASPVIGADGTIYLGSFYTYRLIAFSGSAPPAEAPWPMFLRDPRHSGRVQETVPHSPRIARAPGNATAILGEPARLYVLASASPAPAYQWRLDGELIPGATNAAYYVPSVEWDHAGSYQVLVGNTHGTVTSASARLTVLEPPVIAEHPKSQLVRPGASVTLTVTAVSSKPLAYQWLFNETIILGAVNASLVLSNFQEAEAGEYSVRVTNADGSVMSGKAALRLLVAGVRLWELETGWQIRSSPAIGEDGVIYFGTGGGDNKLYACNPDGSVRWIFQADHAVESSPAIGDDGTIYFGSSDGKVNALHPDGTKAWEFQTGGQILSSPGLGRDGAVYIASWDKFLYALNPDGAERWRFETTSYVSSPAVAGDGTVYIGGTDGVFYAINGDGTEKWKFQVGGSIGSSPALGADGTIYFGGENNKVYALNADGSKKWEFATGGVISEASAVIGPDGTIYIGSWDQKLHAIHPDGTRKWEFLTGGMIDSAPALAADGTIYIGSLNGILYALGSDGGKRWEFQANSGIRSAPAIGRDGAVYFGSGDHHFYAVAGESPLASSPWPMFQCDTRHTGRGILQPSIQMTSPSDGTFFTTEESIVLEAAASSPNGAVAAVEFFAGANLLGSATVAPYRFVWSNAPPGTYELRVKATDAVGAAQITGAVKVTVVAPNTPPRVTLQPQGQRANNGEEVSLGVEAIGSLPLVYQWFKDGEPIAGAMASKLVLRNVSLRDSAVYHARVSNSTGTVPSEPAIVSVLQPVTRLWGYSLGTSYAPPAIGMDGTIYLTSFGHLHALNPDGTARWRYRIGESTVRPAAALGRDGTIYFGAYTQKLYAMNPDGTKKWEFLGAGLIDDSAAIGADGTIYFGGESKRLFALNPDGREKWSLATTNAITSSPVIGVNGVIYAGSGPVLLAVNPEGARLWRFATGGVIESSPALGSDGAIYFGSTDGNLYALNPDGTKRWELATGGPVESSPAIGTEETIYVGTVGGASMGSRTEGKLLAARPDGTKKWEFAARDGVYSSPAVAEDGTIYFRGTDGMIYAVNGNGTLKWEFTAGGRSGASPAIGPDGTIYIGGDGELLAFKGSSGLALSSWPMFRRDYRNRGRVGERLGPALRLVSPLEGRNLAGERLVLEAEVTETDEPVVRVEFYSGETLLGSAASAPYRFSWANVASGPYEVRARAIDRFGNSAFSASLNITVEPHPGVSIASPVTGQTFLRGETISIGADVSRSLRPVVQVDFFQNGAWIGTAASSPFQFAWNNALAGEHALTAQMTDDRGLNPISRAVNISVLERPAIRLERPVVGDNFTLGQTVPLLADVSGSSNPVRRVEFFAGTELAGARTNSPWTSQWNPAAPGPWVLRARLTDSVGNEFDSAPATVWVFAPGREAIAFPSFASSEGWILDGSASIAEGRLRLGSGAAHETGGAWLNTRRYLAEGFEMNFEFAITNRLDGGGEGFAFVIQGNPAPRMGEGGSGLGYQGIPRSVAIEFDTRQDLFHSDPNAHHISVHSRRAEPNHPDEAFSWGSFPWENNFADGKRYRARVTYEADGTLRVYVEPFTSPVISIAVSLAGILDQGQAWIGFTAATGAGAERHDIFNWTFVSPGAQPTVVQQPQSQSVVAGTGVSFSVGATGAAPLAYQWRHDGSVIPGATGPALNLPQTRPGDSGDYTVEVSNALGSVISQPARLDVTLFGTRRWEFDAGSAIYASPAMAPDGTLYVAAEGTGAIADRLIAIRPDGTSSWTLPLPHHLRGAPALGVDGTIYVSCRDHKLYAIHPDGRVRWEFETQDSLTASPAVGADGTVYVGSLDGYFYAIHPDGARKWRFETGGGITSSAAIDAAGVIYFGSHDRKIYALNPDGTKKWEFSTGGEIHASPALGADGTIYIPSLDGRLYAVTPDGVQRWSLPNAGSDSSPVIGPNGAIYAGRGWQMLAVRANGTLQWSFGTEGKVGSPAVAADGTIYFGSLDGRFYAVNADGGKVWDSPSGAFGFGESSPLIGPDGAVYAGSYDGVFYAFNGGAPLAESSWPMFRRDLGRSGSLAPTGPPVITMQPQSKTVGAGTNVTFTVAAIGAAPLSYQWRRDGGGLADGGNISGTKTEAMTITGARLEQSGAYSVLVTNPAGETSSLPASLKVLPIYQPPGTKLWEFTAGDLIETAPAIGEEGVVYAGSRDGNLYAIDRTGARQWAFPTVGGSMSPPVIGLDGTIYVGSASLQNASQSAFYAIRPDGTARWTLPLRTNRTPPAVGADGTIYLHTEDGQLRALFPDGGEKWAFATGAVAYLGPPAVARDGTIYVGSGRGDAELGFNAGEFFALYPDGTLKWDFRARGPFTGAAALGHDGAIYFGSFDNEGRLYAFDFQGRRQWEYRTGASIGSSPVIGRDGTIYVGNLNNTLWALTPHGTRLWTFSTAGLLTTPALAEDGTIYFGSSDGLLYALGSDGAEQWRFNTGTGHLLNSSPAIGEFGEVIFGAGTKLFAVQGSSGLARSAWPKWQRDSRQSASAQASTPLPTVVITLPAAGTRFPPGQNIELTARVFGGTEPITRVEYFDGANSIGAAASPPYPLAWQTSISGVHALAARVTDSSGAVGISGEIRVVINALPSALLTAPENGAVFNEYETVVLRAEASDPDGWIERVDFFNGASRIHSATREPYRLSLSGLAPGAHLFWVQATDNLGGVVSSSVTIARINARPTVSITEPLDGARFSAGGSVLVAASASDPDGTIARVEFFNGFNFLGAVEQPPYGMLIPDLSPGEHTFLARAVDNLGTASIAVPVTVSAVAANRPPTVRFKNPFHRAMISSGADIPIVLEAADPDGALATVRLLANNTALATFSPAGPFQFSWRNPPPGEYLLTAQAADHQGATGLATIQVTILDSTVAPPDLARPDHQPDPALWVTDGEVFTILEHGGTIYIGGSFNHIGQHVPGTSVLELSADIPDLSYPAIDGLVNVMIPDGEGGFYLGGLFQSVAGVPRRNLARIRSDKTLDLEFAPVTSGHVLALLISGETLYIGGEFHRVNGRQHPYLAALDKRTGAMKSWNPEPTGWVSSLARQGDLIYAGGSFTYIGGKYRNYLAAVDAGTGLASPWNPDLDGWVSQIELARNRAYVVGSFRRVGGQLRSGLAAIGLASGLPNAFNEVNEGGAQSIALAGDLVFVGGGFGRMGGADRQNLAALDVETGWATDWRPEVNGPIHEILLSENHLYLAGQFSEVNGVSRARMAVLDLGRGQVTDLDLNPSGRMAGFVELNGRVLGAGALGLIRIPRNGLAALDAATGFATGWDPQCDGNVHALAAIGETLFVGGTFHSLGGQPRHSLGAVSTVSGLATPFDPRASAVRALALEGDTLFVGGFFQEIAGESRRFAAGFEASTGQLTPWHPEPDDGVVSLVVSGGGIYAAGPFTRIGGESRRHLAELNFFTGRATPWNPSPNGPVASLAAGENTIYAGGAFNKIGGEQRLGLAALDRAAGRATAWRADADGSVLALELVDGLLYAGGQFQSIGGLPRFNLAALDTRISGANAVDWTPNPGEDDSTAAVWALAATDATVYAGGRFLTVEDRPQPYLAAFDLPTRISAPLGLPDGLFRVRLIGPLGRYYTFEASTDLQTWTPLFTGRAPFLFEDIQAFNLPHRFYRAVPAGER